MTVKEKAHTNRVLRVLIKAQSALEKLSEAASEEQLFPRTTQKAYIETSKVLLNTRMRIFARHADAI